ncbi:MAG: TatD family hydrolase, partial [Acidobacteriota bacterium]
EKDYSALVSKLKGAGIDGSRAELRGRLARACLDLGLHLSFSGILTFRSADDLRSVARRVPARRLLVETDSPYLAPAPHRGGRNEPARVLEVLRVLAEIRGTPLVELAQQTSANFAVLFRTEKKVKTAGA